MHRVEHDALGHPLQGGPARQWIRGSFPGDREQAAEQDVESEGIVAGARG